MNMKNTFLNSFIKEEAYVKEPPCFENTSKWNHVFKLKKTLYGLKQAFRAWYNKLSSFLLKIGFGRGKVDNNLFKKEHNKDLQIV